MEFRKAKARSNRSATETAELSFSFSSSLPQAGHEFDLTKLDKAKWIEALITANNRGTGPMAIKAAITGRVIDRSL